MGTDMHAFIEVDHGRSPQAFSEPADIHSLTAGSFLHLRRYMVFDALAGGRDCSLAPEDCDPARRPLVAPRGMPTPCSLSVGHNYYYLVCGRDDLPNRYFWPASRCVAPDEASAWVRDQGSHEAQVVQWFNGDRTWRAVSEPAYYGATWLSPTRWMRHWPITGST